MRVFLTGGSGFLGRYIVERAVADGAEVVGLVRPHSAVARLQAQGATLHSGDLLDRESLVTGMRGCDAVVHAASPKGGWRRPEVYGLHTVEGTKNLLGAMAQSGVRRLIHISTISVHGLDPLHRTVDDADGRGKHFLPYDHYGRAKADAEELVLAAHRAGVVQATVLRPGWLYGPGDQHSYGRLADRLRRGFLLRVGDGANRIPLVYATNVAGAVWRAVVSPSTECRRILYAWDGLISQTDLLTSLARAAGWVRPIRSFPRVLLLTLAGSLEQLAARSGYRLPAPLTRYFVHLIGSDWHFAQRQLGDKLGYQPEVSLEEGLAATEHWYRRDRGLSQGSDALEEHRAT